MYYVLQKVDYKNMFIFLVVKMTIAIVTWLMHSQNKCLGLGNDVDFLNICELRKPS